MIGVGDVQSYVKKISDKGNMNICPRTKSFNEKVGGVMLAGAIAIAGFSIFFNKITDLLIPDIKPSRKHMEGFNNNYRMQNDNKHQFRR